MRVLGGSRVRSHIVLRFPKGASAAKRAAFVGGVVLIEYTSMELKRMQEGNSPSAGGGGNADRKALYQSQSKHEAAADGQPTPIPTPSRDARRQAAVITRGVCESSIVRVRCDCARTLRARSRYA